MTFSVADDFTPLQLITAVDPSILKLTPMDDEIHKQFREDFKDLKVDILQEDDIKSEANKQVYCVALSFILLPKFFPINSKYILGFLFYLPIN